MQPKRSVSSRTPSHCGLDVAVGNGLPVITYAIVDQMAMGMGLVEVPPKVLRIGDAHLLHVFPGNLSSARR